MENKRPVLITAGGTGGHVYPGLAVARALQAQNIPVVWMGTPKGFEARVIPEAGIEMALLEVTGLRGKGITTLLLAPFRLVKALYQSVRIMQKHKPAAVLGMGGFVAGPGGLVASLMGIPVIIHEQNAIPGLTNRLLSKFSRKVLEGFPGTFHQAGNKAVPVGNPVRQDISSLPAPTERMKRDDSQLHLLIIGGSLGAQALNETVPQALAELAPEMRPVVRHQAGKNKDESTREQYAKSGVEATVSPFIEDMGEAYGWADLVICRSGALTVTELAAAGLASILVPYPYAVDDHQTANGLYLSENGAAILVSQSDLTVSYLAQHLQSLTQEPERLLQMGEKARELARPNATEAVAAIVAEMANYTFNTEVVA
ncbi:undecaprenyldiphospho-muramoylpentapeptide beta-N-acetylglucosaminyltransferase [Leucothrix mucor]|uniref:undecaprenyldiphospho-muramoylpentapeptide beta-N-acetylglucosaminyltransferase n=1 Tax=Leucothrix mucor TaxID=45248 RepID=UPI0003B44567|nr:undecaprenyldiphospho-muramoylpentapeptide beta-N-acetylglucosaminyltransferase [Leucothrix mucor]